MKNMAQCHIGEDQNQIQGSSNPVIKKKKLYFYHLTILKHLNVLNVRANIHSTEKEKQTNYFGNFIQLLRLKPEYSDISRLTVCFLTTTLFKQSGRSPIIVLEMSGNLGVIRFRYSSRSVEARSTKGSWVKLHTDYGCLPFQFLLVSSPAQRCISLNAIWQNLNNQIQREYCMASFHIKNQLQREQQVSG